jgi:hypothetical protein
MRALRAEPRAVWSAGGARRAARGASPRRAARSDTHPSCMQASRAAPHARQLVVCRPHRHGGRLRRAPALAGRRLSRGVRQCCMGSCSQAGQLRLRRAVLPARRLRRRVRRGRRRLRGARTRAARGLSRALRAQTSSNCNVAERQGHAAHPTPLLLRRRQYRGRHGRAGLPLRAPRLRLRRLARLVHKASGGESVCRRKLLQVGLLREGSSRRDGLTATACAGAGHASRSAADATRRWGGAGRAGAAVANGAPRCVLVCALARPLRSASGARHRRGGRRALEDGGRQARRLLRRGAQRRHRATDAPAAVGGSGGARRRRGRALAPRAGAQPRLRSLQLPQRVGRGFGGARSRHGARVEARCVSVSVRVRVARRGLGSCAVVHRGAGQRRAGAVAPHARVGQRGARLRRGARQRQGFSACGTRAALLARPTRGLRRSCKRTQRTPPWRASGARRTSGARCAAHSAAGGSTSAPPRSACPPAAAAAAASAPSASRRSRAARVRGICARRRRVGATSAGCNCRAGSR